MRKIRGIIPVTNSLSICQFNIKLGQLPVGLGQEQDEATGAGRAAWLSYSELKCSWCYSLSLKSKMTQQNTLNWFLDLCIVVLCTHYPKYPRKKAANSELAYTFPAGLGRLVVVRGIPCQHEFIQGSDLPDTKWFSDHSVAWRGQGGAPPKSILRLKLASLGLSTRIDKPAKSSLNFS